MTRVVARQIWIRALIQMAAQHRVERVTRSRWCRSVGTAAMSAARMARSGIYRRPAAPDAEELALMR
jgi:hypothetical protein